jgi:gluconolactonase
MPPRVNSRQVFVSSSLARRGGKQTPELPPSLYRLDPQNGSLQLMADDFEGPNGLAFSPDESLLYVSESGCQFDADPTQYIRMFDVVSDGKQLSECRIFHKVMPGYADGFRIDQDGNLWSSAADGVHCIAPDGTKLGAIKVPFIVSNLTFGGRNRSRLFICASHTLFAIYTNQRGAQSP